MHQVGLRLDGRVRNTVIEREGPGIWRTFDDGTVWRNILVIADGGGQFVGGALLQEPELARSYECAEYLADSAQNELPFWAPLGPRAQSLTEPISNSDQNLDPGSNLAGWVEAFVLLPALQHHLAMLPRVDRANHNSASKFADEVLHVVHDDKLRYRTVIPLSGIDLGAAPGRGFTRKELSIRRLTPSEQGSWFKKVQGLFSESADVVDPPQVELSFTFSGPRTSQYISSVSAAQRLITALQMTGHRVAGRFAYESAVPDWVSAGSLRIPLTLPRGATTSSMLTRRDFNVIIDTAKQLANYDIEQPKSPQDLALHRFAIGTARGDPADAVLDFTIALEALLLPYDEATRRGDLGYRFRMHGAHYLSTNTDQRTAVAKRLRTIYEMRSRLVHGGHYPNLQEITATGDDARHLARVGLLRAVRNGFPKATDFNHMILGVDP
jgi:hypothetical protein